MTAEEAIKEFKDRIELGKKEYLKDIPEYIEALEMAIEALEKVEKYRALGTVEELKEAKEKQIPKKWKYEEDLFSDVFFTCPICNNAFTLIEGTLKDNEYNHCPACGQRLEDWSEE